MTYGEAPYGGLAYGGAVVVPAASDGGVITDPGNPGGSGWSFKSQGGGGPYGGIAYGGGGLLGRPASGGISATPDPLLGLVRLSVWWSGAPYLRVVRVVNGVRSPVRGAYPVTVRTATRRNRCTNPSAEVDTAGWLAGANTTVTRAVPSYAVPSGLAVFRLTATAAGAVNTAVPVALPLSDGLPQLSFALRLSALPSGALTATVTWRDAAGTTLGTTSASIASGALATYVGRYDRIPTLAIPGYVGAAGGNAVASGTLALQIAGMAAGGTAELDAVLIEGAESAPAGGAYFDGTYPYAAWAGTPHASESSLAAVQEVEDREAPLDVPITYELRAPDQPTFFAVSEAVTLESGERTWLTHPDRGRAFLATVAEEPEQTRDITRGVFQVIGRSRPVAVTSAQRQSSAATLTVWTETFEERDELLDLLDDGAPLLLRAPASLGHGPGEWLSIGAVQYKAVGHGAWEHTREFSLPYVVVDAPAADDALAVA
jgi:hypothetical protein